MNDRDEWRRDVARMTEWERHVTNSEVQRTRGLVGDVEDARDE